MKNFSLNTLIIVLFALLTGFVFGRIMPVKVKIEKFYNEVYAKLHPAPQKDIKTLIIEKAAGNSFHYSGDSIFEEPEI